MLVTKPEAASSNPQFGNPQFGIGPKEPIGVRQWRKYKLIMAVIISSVTVGTAGLGYLIFQGITKKAPETIQTPVKNNPDQAKSSN